MVSRRRVPRLSASRRRAAILDALVPVFAEQGLHGATTRELAAAAGVSEALLYRHFPSKEALYAAIQRHVQRAPRDEPGFAAWRDLPPSTAKLVRGVGLLLRHLLARPAGAGRNAPRLMLQSLLEDGAFARRRLEDGRATWVTPLVEALRAARKAGDVTGAGGGDERAIWFVHHVGLAARSLALPGRVLDYGAARARVAEEATRFALRGLGLTDAAWARHRKAAGAASRGRRKAR